MFEFRGAARATRRPRPKTAFRRIGRVALQHHRLKPDRIEKGFGCGFETTAREHELGLAGDFVSFQDKGGSFHPRWVQIEFGTGPGYADLARRRINFCEVDQMDADIGFRR